MIPDSLIYDRDIFIKVIWFLPKSRHVDKQNILKDTNMITHNYSHLIFDKDNKSIHYKEDKTASSEKKIVAE